jgi:hypothetical protein
MGTKGARKAFYISEAWSERTFSCNVAAAIVFRGCSKMDGTVGSGSDGAIRPPATGAQQ